MRSRVLFSPLSEVLIRRTESVLRRVATFDCYVPERSFATLGLNTHGRRAKARSSRCLRAEPRTVPSASRTQPSPSQPTPSGLGGGHRTRSSPCDPRRPAPDRRWRSRSPEAPNTFRAARHCRPHSIRNRTLGNNRCRSSTPDRSACTPRARRTPDDFRCRIPDSPRRKADGSRPWCTGRHDGCRSPCPTTVAPARDCRSSVANRRTPRSIRPAATGETVG